MGNKLRLGSPRLRIELCHSQYPMRASIIMRKANELGIIFNSLVSHLRSWLLIWFYFTSYFRQRSSDIYAPFVFTMCIVHWSQSHSGETKAEDAFRRWASWVWLAQYNKAVNFCGFDVWAWLTWKGCSHKRESEREEREIRAADKEYLKIYKTKNVKENVKLQLYASCL